MRYLLLSVLVVCVIGVMVPNAVAEKIPISAWTSEILWSAYNNQLTDDEILDVFEYLVNLDYYDEYELEPSSRPDCSNNDCIPGWISQQGSGMWRNPAETPNTISYFVDAGLIGISDTRNTIEIPLDFSWKEDQLRDFDGEGRIAVTWTKTDSARHIIVFGTPTCEDCASPDDPELGINLMLEIHEGNDAWWALNTNNILNKQIDYFCAVHPWERGSFQINESDLTYIEPEIESEINVYSATQKYYKSKGSNATPCTTLDYPSECVRFEINRGHAPYDAKLTFAVMDPNGDVNSTWECKGESCDSRSNELVRKGALGQMMRVSEKKINGAFDSENWILKICAPEHNICVEKHFEIAIEVDIIRDKFYREFHMDGFYHYKEYGTGKEYTTNALIEEFGSERLEKFITCTTGGFKTKDCNITEDRDFAIQFIHDRADWYLEEIHTALEIAENGIVSKDMPTDEKADIIQTLRNHVNQMEDEVSNNKTSEISSIDRAISEFLHSEQEKLEREQLEDEIESEREQLEDEIESRSETTSEPLITEKVC